MAARRRRGLDGESADRAIINVTAMRVVVGHCPRDQVPDFTARRPAHARILRAHQSIQLVIRELPLWHRFSSLTASKLETLSSSAKTSILSIWAEISPIFSVCFLSKAVSLSS